MTTTVAEILTAQLKNRKVKHPYYLEPFVLDSVKFEPAGTLILIAKDGKAHRTPLSVGFEIEEKASLSQEGEQ